MVDIEVLPTNNANLFHLVSLVPLQRIQVDNPTFGLYYFEVENKVVLYLQTHGANPKTLIEKKVINFFLKTNIILDPKVVYKDIYNIDYTRVPKEVVQTYHFGGLPLYDAIG